MLDSKYLFTPLLTLGKTDFLSCLQVKEEQEVERRRQELEKLKLDNQKPAEARAT